jgi:hypothetical protein
VFGKTTNFGTDCFTVFAMKSLSVYCVTGEGWLAAQLPTNPHPHGFVKIPRHYEHREVISNFDWKQVIKIDKDTQYEIF